MSHVGRYVLKNPSKYLGVGKNPVYKSGLELRAFNWLDINSKVVRWGYEIIKIPYFFQIDSKIHTYFVDIYSEVIDKNGNLAKYIAEIKSGSDIKPPVQPKSTNKRSSRNYRKSLYTYIKNTNKWKAARQVADKMNWKFILLDEKVLY